MALKPKYLLVTAMKNEGPYILDWVAHHLAIGINHFFVATNDCDDGTDRILDRLAEMGHVTHVPNPKMLRRDLGQWQVMALRYAKLFNVYRDAEWIFHSDVDEYLQIHTAEQTLDSLLDVLGPTDVISFTSIPYNSNGQRTLIDEPVSAQFTQRNKIYSSDAGGQVKNAIKTMYRNDIPFRVRRNHRPLWDGFSASNRVWRNGSGTEMSSAFTDGSYKAMNALKSVKYAQLNHYAIRSAEAYLVKVDRGDVAGTSRLQASLKYWRGYNRTGENDDHYAVPTERARQLKAEFLNDPELLDWHEFAVTAHLEKVSSILETEDGQALAREIGYFDPKPGA